MRFALLLALLLPSLAFGDGGYLMDRKAKDESLQILNEVEVSLTTLKESLQKATDYSSSLDEDLKLASLKLANSEKLLNEAKANLETSENNLQAVQMLLDQASKALADSEKSFKDYQKSEFLRLIASVVGGVVCGALTFWAITAHI